MANGHKNDFTPRLRDHRGHREEMQAKTVGQETRDCNLVVPVRARRSTFLCTTNAEFLVGPRRFFGHAAFES